MAVDAVGRMVESGSGGAYTQVVCAPAGGKLALMNGQTLSKGFVPLSGGALQYYHQDHLSVRTITDASGKVIGSQAHFPFGEQWYATNTTTKWFFTRYERDPESGNDYAMAREYVNRLGRFSALDPLSGSAADPQSLDRYSYAENDPINNVDPSGQNMSQTYVNFWTALWWMSPLVDFGLTDDEFGIIQLAFTPTGYMGWLQNGLLVAPVPIYGNSSVLGLLGLPMNDGPLPLNLGQWSGPDIIQRPQPCEQQNLNAVNNQFGTGFTTSNVEGMFQYSTGAPAGTGTLNLGISVPSQYQSNGISPGRYPVNWWTYIIGYGPTLHIPAVPAGMDSSQTLFFSNGQFTEHLDSAFLYNPFGALLHLLKDVLGIGGNPPCP